MITRGLIQISLSLGPVDCVQSILIVDHLPYNILLGVDFLPGNKCIINMTNEELVCDAVNLPFD